MRVMMAGKLKDCYLRGDIAALWPAEQVLDRARALQGDVYREVGGRRTLKVSLGGRSYFAKLHDGAGWLEVLKNWLTLKRPVLGARNEYEACRYLAEQNITAPRVAAFAESAGFAPKRFSVVLCDALEDFENLEEQTLRWFDDPPTAAEKRALVMSVAEFARTFHDAGVVHRDFYLCHLLASTTLPGAPLAVLDLHRARIFARLPRRWRRRDLAALLYSALDLPLQQRAWLRFVRVYTNQPLQQTFASDGAFWRSVYRRALKLYRKGLRKNLVRGHFSP